MIGDVARRSTRDVLVSLLFVVMVGSGLSQAISENDPFFDQTKSVLRAHGVEMLSSRLVGIETLASSEADALDDDAFGDVIEAVVVDFRRFAATLAVLDARLAEELQDAIGAMEGASDSGEARAVADSASAARSLAVQAHAALIGNAYEHDPPLAAAVIATMITTENFGIGRVFEEAVEGEVGPYVTAWSTLRRARGLWAQLEPLATEKQRAEVEGMLAELEALFPGPRPESEDAGSDAGDAKRATQSIGAILEQIVNADLYPPRDIGKTFAKTRDLSVQACEAYAASDRARGLELISNAALLYAEYLDDTLATLSHEAAEEVTELYHSLAPGAMGEDEGEDEAQGADGGQEAEPLAAHEATAACKELLEWI